MLCTCVYRFRPAVVKAIIHDVLNEELSGKQYNSEEATSWSKHISDTVKDKLKGIEFTIKIAVIVKRRLRTADCRPGVKCRLQTESKTQAWCKMQNPEGRLWVKISRRS